MLKRAQRWTGHTLTLSLLILVANLLMGGWGAPMSPAFASASTSSSWKATELPLPTSAVTAPGDEPSIGPLSCPASGFCVAIASYFDGQNHIHGVIETLAHGTWTAIEEPVPADASYSNLSAVSCPTVTYCVAVGWYAPASDEPVGLIETLSGGRWTEHKSPLPANVPTISSIFLNALACPAVGSCVAVGSYHPQPNSSGSYGLIETLDGKQWSATVAPLPANAQPGPGAQLGSITCPTIDFCVSIGYYFTTRGEDPRVIETLAGGTWTPTSVPTQYLSSAQCPASGSCVAVGQLIRSGQSSPLVETLSSGTWTMSTAPLPANTITKRQWSYLDDVVCPPLGSCVAIGDYTTTNSTEDGLVETLVQGTWTAEDVPPPAPSFSINENALACADASFCVAVGVYTYGAGGSSTQAGLIDTMTDGIWTSSTAPIVRNGGSVYLDDVECPGTHSCIALGTYLDGNGNYQLVAESLG